VDTAWVTTAEMGALFVLPTPAGAATYIFEVAAVDNDDNTDPTPARQEFNFFNTPPVVDFEAGTLPDTTLPAITFYLTAVDPDTTADEEDRDSRVHLDHYRVWLDGNEAGAKVVPIEPDAVTFREGDFENRYGVRTIFVQALDDGGAQSAAIQHTWEVNSAPDGGILLVDDCTMGGFLALESDASYRAVLATAAPGVHRVLDIDALPRLSRDDLDATLALFDRVVWYTDGDSTSSGALELVRESLLELLEERQGRFLLSSGVVFGTGGVIGDFEDRFFDHFGIESLHLHPDGGTNFKFEPRAFVEARVHPGVTQFRIARLGIEPVMECFRSRAEAGVRPLYFFPDSVYTSSYDSSGVAVDFSNAVQFDIGVYKESESGARAAYTSFPLGWVMRGADNRTEILEVLRLLGIVE
jgi:hypothetical protein